MDTDLQKEKFYYVGTEEYEDNWYTQYSFFPFNRLTLSFQRQHYFNVLKYLEEGDIPDERFLSFFGHAMLSISLLINQEFKSKKDDTYKSIEYNCLLAIKRYLEQLNYIDLHFSHFDFFKEESQPMDVSFTSTL